MRKRILLPFVFLVFCGFNLSAVSIDPPEKTPYDCFKDEEEKIVYIDFESVLSNVVYVVVKDKEGEIVCREDVRELPVDFIYEIDYSKFLIGDYTIELHTYSDVLSQKLELE